MKPEPPETHDERILRILTAAGLGQSRLTKSGQASKADPAWAECPPGQEVWSTQVKVEFEAVVIDLLVAAMIIEVGLSKNLMLEGHIANLRAIAAQRGLDNLRQHFDEVLAGAPHVDALELDSWGMLMQVIKAIGELYAVDEQSDIKRIEIVDVDGPPRVRGKS